MIVRALQLTSCILFTVSKSRADVLQGPGDYARIIPNSEDIPAEQLPLEHRGESALVLPDVFSVSRNLTSLLNVDLFFSLFFVFLNNPFDVSYEEFTIFAPAHLPTSEATLWLSTEEKLTEELLLNHIVLGEHLRPEMILTTPGVIRSTLGGLEVAFDVDDDGEIYVNNVKIVAWKKEGKALIIALDDYLFKQEVKQEVKNHEVSAEEIFRNGVNDDEEEEEWGEERGDLESALVADATAEELIPTPRNQKKRCNQVENKSGLSIFKTITVCTENVLNNGTEDFRQPSQRKLDINVPILTQLENQLAFMRGGPGLEYFLNYANQTNLAQHFNPKKSYTILAPVDEAFQSWHPIDWGFNPFLVESFLEDIMTNMIIENNGEATDEKTEYKTLGDRDVIVSSKGENVYVNGILILGELPINAGQSEILFLDKVPWIDDQLVEILRQNYSHLETGPPSFNGTFESLNNGSTILLEADSDDATTINSVDATEDNLVKDEFYEENDDELSLVDDLVNFPTTTTVKSDEEMLTSDMSHANRHVFHVSDDAVNFPPNITSLHHDVDESNVKFYNRSLNTDPSLLVLRLKQLLQSETPTEEQLRTDSKQTRIVYINNQRVEVEITTEV